MELKDNSQDTHDVGTQSDWAPLQATADGIDEIDAEWVAANRDAVQVIDVREPDEYHGPLGHIEDAALIPLAQLAAGKHSIGKDLPIVAVCLGGGRSAQACMLLQRTGFKRVANLAGGMVRWHELGLPVSRGG